MEMHCIICRATTLFLSVCWHGFLLSCSSLWRPRGRRSVKSISPWGSMLSRPRLAKVNMLCPEVTRIWCIAHLLSSKYNVADQLRDENAYSFLGEICWPLLVLLPLDLRLPCCSLIFESLFSRWLLIWGLFGSLLACLVLALGHCNACSDHFKHLTDAAIRDWSQC
jgi:hypothetical protein